MNADVADVNDVRTVIHEFYDSIVEDPAIGHFFRDVDWSHHLPKMVRFWSAVALGKPGYRGNPMAVHAQLKNLKREHFSVWVHRFTGTVDRHFAGPRADQMKQSAFRIAHVMQLKLGVDQ